mmetsp:Transcript_13859/g.21121  ORF Transcript_13859/g.21121 Transcript_13859/m.21121 type:complete len:238 (-) Transcript_13859:85-798(-)|eukprot:CAMPEP_0178919074 /NCGR_PEP_ID=MMETSP0786-20121207/14216_1 /TAXON_ID=186022 /ORGANISM="Thalassionema frauenfeldii, Strain CCMP 1798" /LENGTH=237 /DNA_ID=CAMNT_0020592927 /DNA_START=14 /DNA_END=727 /DNA_ORIENTATION=-
MSGSHRHFSRTSSTSSTSENLPPRTLTRVAREIRDLHKSPPEGIKLVVDGDGGGSLGEIMAEIDGPTGTPYESKYFQLKLIISADFPSSPPRGFFLTKIYHPNVDMSNGAICVNTLKKDWTPETTFSHVLSVIRCLLIVPFPESSLNDEAGKLFMESYEEYSKRAKLMASIHGRSKVVADESNDKSLEDENNGCTSSKINSASTDRSLKSMNRSSSVTGKASSKLDKKSKKKSLRRL